MVRVTVPVQVNGHNLIYFVYVLTIEGVLELNSMPCIYFVCSHN